MNNLHPLGVFMCVMSAAAVAAVFSDPLLLLTALGFGLVFAALSGVRRPWLYLILPVAAALINPLFSHRGNTVLFFVNNSAVTLEAVMAGLNSGVMLTALILWFGAYSRIMTADKQLWLFGRLTPRIGLTLSAALRFVPLFVRRFGEISSAQKAMGLYSSKAVPDRIRSRLSVFGAAFDWATENGVITAVSMRSRGYGAGRRSSYTLFRLGAGDVFVSVLSPLLAAVVMINAGELRFVFYPELSPLSGAAVPRLAYGLLCALPVLIEIKERLAWKYSASKISASPTPAPADLLSKM